MEEHSARKFQIQNNAEPAPPGRRCGPLGGDAEGGAGGLYFVPIQASSEARMASSTDISMGVVQLRGTNTV